MVGEKLENLAQGVKAGNMPIGVSVSRSQAAEMLNVGIASVQRATQVLKKATPETIAAVESGNLPVSVATHLRR